MATLLSTTTYQGRKADGTPNALGKVYTYAAGTLTAQASYTTAALSVANTNPVILGADGCAAIHLDPDLAYRIREYTSADVLIRETDNYRTGSGVDGSGRYVFPVEKQTATAGQTVFNLGITYAPGTDSLQVLVDGADVDVGTDYTETDADTVTFVSGLQAGQEVKFRAGRYVTTGVDSASVSHIAGGTGAVGISQATWNGAVTHSRSFYGNGEADSTAGVQAFWNQVTAVGGLAIIHPGDTTLTSGITITLGSKGFKVITGGAEGTRFLAGSTFVGATPVIKIIGSGAQPGTSLGEFSIRGEATAGVCPATCGLQVGNESASASVIAGFNSSVIAGVFVANFPVGIDIVHARLIRFERCAVWNDDYTAANTCWRIRHNGLYTNDLVFDRCQGVTTTAAGYTGLDIVSSGTAYNNSTGAGSVTGIKFHDCDFYAGEKAIRLYASGASRISDVWFTQGCQIDQEVTYGIFIESNGSSANIEHINIDGLYFSKSAASSITLTSTGTGGVIQQVWITDNYLNRCDVTAINVVGAAVKDVYVTGNSIIDCDSSGAAIIFSSCVDFICTGNKLVVGEFSKDPAYFIQLASGCARFVVSHNDTVGATTAGILDSSGDVVKNITGNIGFNPVAERTLTVGSSPYSYKNTTGAPEVVYITGGTVSGVTLNGRAVPTTSGIYHTVPQGMTLAVTHSSAPTMYATGAA